MVGLVAPDDSASTPMPSPSSSPAASPGRPSIQWTSFVDDELNVFRTADERPDLEDAEPLVLKASDFMEQERMLDDAVVALSDDASETSDVDQEAYMGEADGSFLHHIGSVPLFGMWVPVFF